MRVNIAIPESNVTAPVLNGALETVTRLNEDLIKSGESPTSHQLLEQGAKWKPEPPGDEHFDHGALIDARGWGDCDDWAPLHAATLRATGEDPGAKAVVKKSGPKRWHATVIRSDGSEDDPSLAAGMPGPARTVGARGAFLPMMQRTVSGVNGAYIARPSLALRPIPDRMGQPEAWQARTDLPWHWGPPGTSPNDVAMAALHMSPVADQAVTGAVRGLWRLGCANQADPEQLNRLMAISDAIEGASWEELNAEYGPEHATAAGSVVGSFFGSALRSLGRVAKGLVRPALSLVPGGGLATAAFDAASPALQHSVLKQAYKPPAERTASPVRVVQITPQQQAALSRPAAAAAPAAAQQPHQIINFFGSPPPSMSPGPGVAWPRS